MQHLLILAAAGAISLIPLKCLPYPYIWISATMVLALGILARRLLSERLRFISVNVAALVLAFGGYESYLAVRDASRAGNRALYPEGYIVENEYFGYSATKDFSGTARRYQGDELVYEVSYIVDSHGLRLSPPTQGSPAGSALFFGGSFTFGEGVRDDQTLPYQAGVQNGGRLRVHNFGFHGYGPHQMLAALEQGFVESVVTEAPKYAIYQGMLPHISRAAGLSRWDLRGPKFSLVDGAVVHLGSFDTYQGQNLIADKILRQLRKSLALRKVLSRRAGPAEVELFIRLVRKAARTFEERYPGAEFHVLLWDSERAQYSTGS